MSLAGLVGGYASDSSVDDANVPNVDPVETNIGMQQHAPRDLVPSGTVDDMLSKRAKLNEKLSCIRRGSVCSYDAAVAELSANSIRSFLNIDNGNSNLTKKIREKKDFGNPHILQKVVDHYKIDDIGSNYPPDNFAPHAFPESDYEENIQKVSTICSSLPPVVATYAPNYSNGSYAETTNKRLLEDATLPTDIAPKKRQSRWGANNNSNFDKRSL